MAKLPMALVALVLLLLAFFLYREQDMQVATVPPNTYTNSTYDIVFSYPDGYVLSEKDIESNGHYTVMLVRVEEATPVEGGEGPTGISVDIYPTTLPLVDWVRTTNASNFGLGNGTYASTTVDEKEAVTYRWSGLYEGESTVFKQSDYIISVSVTRLTPDEHTEAYQEVLASFSLK